MFVKKYLQTHQPYQKYQKKNPTYSKGLKTLTPKQMSQRLLIALAQVKAGNT